MKFVRLSLIISLLVPVALSAATSKRRVTVPVADVSVTGTVKDATTGAPVVLASVAYGRLRVETDNAGQFSIPLPSGRPSVLNVSRSGYEGATQSVTPVTGLNVPFVLKGKPTITLKETNGTIHNLDVETSVFAFAVPFSGYIRNDKANFCKPDGSQFSPDKTEITKIIGPAAPVTAAKCCKDPVLGVTVIMKDGQQTPVTFNDNCTAAEVDFIGRDHGTAVFGYFRFTEIAEITFP